MNVERSEKKIYLCVYDDKNKLIDNNTYWDFDEIEQALNRKMKVLALVKGRKIIRCGKTFYKYESINFYTIKWFNTFIKLLEEGFINISISLGVYKTGLKYGKEHDHGTTFNIKESNLLKLYDKYEM